MAELMTRRLKVYPAALAALALIMIATLPAIAASGAPVAQDAPGSEAAGQNPAVAAPANGTVTEGNTTIQFDSAAATADLNKSELAAFDRISQSDPAMVKALAKNPRLIEDAGFVNRHPGLKDFLIRYPGAKREIATNPGELLPPPTAKGWPH